MWLVEGDDLIDVYLYICLLFPAANVYVFLILWVVFVLFFLVVVAVSFLV